MSTTPVAVSDKIESELYSLFSSIKGFLPLSDIIPQGYKDFATSLKCLCFSAHPQSIINQPTNAKSLPLSHTSWLLQACLLLDGGLCNLSQAPVPHWCRDVSTSQKGLVQCSQSNTVVHKHCSHVWSSSN